MGVSIIIPFRASDDHRLANLRATIAHLSSMFPGGEIIIAEQDTSSRIVLAEFNSKVQPLLIEDSGPFNKSRLINHAVSHTGYPVLLIHDADMLLPETETKRSVAAVGKSLDAARPFHQLIDLSRQQTGHYLRTNELPDKPGTHGYDRQYRGEYLCLAGGAVVIRTEFFKHIGGFDERFQGWGGEDNAFSLLIRSHTRKAAIANSGTAWHLWHPRANTGDKAMYQRNLKLLKQYYSEIADRQQTSKQKPE